MYKQFIVWRYFRLWWYSCALQSSACCWSFFNSALPLWQFFRVCLHLKNNNTLSSANSYKKLQFALFILFPTNKNVSIYLIMKYSAFDLFLGHQFQKGRSRPSCKLFYNNNSLKNLPNFFLATQSRCKLTRRSADQELRNIKADKMKKKLWKTCEKGRPSCLRELSKANFEVKKWGFCYSWLGLRQNLNFF